MAQDATALAKSPGTPAIEWDDTGMKSSYANVCNVNGTREEVVLFFGISNPAQSGGPHVRVQLSDRIILSPFAAKRMAQLLNTVVETYEGRFGSLEADASAQRPTAVPSQKN